jgi:hypothetical protein
MKRLLCVLCLLLLGSSLAIAQVPAVSVDGEAFPKTFVANRPGGDKLLEFVRETESFEKWTKLVGFRYQQLPRIENDPTRAAAAMAQVVKASNPQAQARVITNKDKTETIIDFLTWPPDGSYMEFNVFRYIKSADGNAVVSLQLAHRFTDKSAEGLEKFKRLRDAWITQATAFDMSMIRGAFAQ